MRYISTRGRAEPASFAEAMVRGLAPDGGLYVPDEMPPLEHDWSSWSYTRSMTGALGHFGAEDPGSLVEAAAARFHHPEIAPVVEVGDRLLLELFWGPSLSFKDHALQVVARLLDRAVGHGRILVATSGDTGSAAIEACRGIDGLEVLVLYPEGRVSTFQRRQMTTVDEPNITAVAVRGTFDDCQRMVKAAFSAHPDLLAVNSINWARIAAQVGYYIHAAVRVGAQFDVVVPTGNFGNVYSAWVAKQIGIPIVTITIANNSNHGLADLVETGLRSEETVIPTVAPAMDIQVPSNLERFTGDPSAEFRAGWCDDTQIMATITSVREEHGYELDPHTATAWRVGAQTRSRRPQVIVATAHPAKFDDTIPAPGWFSDPGDAPEHTSTIDALSSELEQLLG